jgi:competence protein ComEA
VVALVGGGILLYGLWGVLKGEETTVEIVRNNPSRSDLVGSENNLQLTRSDLIYVDVGGAVENPGVYKLLQGSRIGDALVAAGGLSEKSDREWVAKTLNLASEVKDGGKLYIPKRDDRETSPQSNGKGVTLGSMSQGKVNINSASVAELDGLNGIGEVRAQAIVANRPYASTQEIVDKAKVPISIYETIKDSLSIY